MKKITITKSTFLVLMSVLFNAALFAQLPETFTNTAHIDNGGLAYGVAVGADGTVFLAISANGLRAYTYDGSSFTNTAHIDDGGNAYGVAVGADGTVFLANDFDGLRSYTYDGSSFTNTAHIDNGGYAVGVAIGADGTIFLANYSDGLRAYTYDGSSFTNTAHIDDGGIAWGVAVSTDGTVFLANYDDGLRAYTYDGSSFTNTAHIDDGGNAYGVAVGADGTVFLANETDGLRAYTYDGSSFTNTAHIDNGGTAFGVAVDEEGTVFSANFLDGLRAYTYDGSSFTNTAHIYTGSYARRVAVGADGTIFLANYADGLRAYTYSGTAVACDDFTIYLKDSNGNPLAGGSLEYREGGGNGWLAATEISDGLFCIDTQRSKVGLRMTYGPQVQKVGDVSTGSDYTFETVSVTVSLEDGGSPVDGGVVKYTSGGWHAFGTTGDDGSGTGTVSQEMLPVQYTFQMKYDGDKENKTELISTSNNLITFDVADLKSAELNGTEDFQLVAYPNPFNGNATIGFSLEEAQEINISVYDQTGRLIEVLHDGMQAKGNHKISWDASEVNTGIYILSLSSGEQVSHKNIVKM